MANEILREGENQTIMPEAALTALALGMGELVNSMLRIEDSLRGIEAILNDHPPGSGGI